MSIVISVPKETRASEQRVALVPDIVKKLNAMGATVRIQSGAGDLAGYGDADYEAASATIVTDLQSLYQSADIVLTVNPLEGEQILHLKDGSILIGYQNPWTQTERFSALKDKHISAFSMEMVPRISRAQAMDTLSSQASIAGYKSVLMAASLSGKFLPMMTTAAGTVRPSKVLIIGAGVAGLQAIATARRLGAIVEGYDVRAAVKEQVESLGAKFVDIDIKAEGSGGYARELTAEEKQLQQDILARHVAAADVVICTAAIPGRPSPRIITTAMVEAMKGGSVIVDLAAEGGGNCELTQAGKSVVHQRVTVFGPVNVAATVPNHASELYSKNLLNMLSLIIKDKAVHIDLEDQILRDSLITHAGEIVNAGVLERLQNTGA
ncbi:MAG: Re/Si-specific NAD(P)(+) transhydrogenase subunit alpha [Pseudohongiella sp.]|nr:Re/Si-specific NAD(P)(+) transhydrogenase subunit alpha [Pseudohongiella sp.]MDO9521718.1 Re/Si-specific NAD(P)(+) transhydrogenase subunit alpha [Pseudohongiella sp.]MDP2128734.1 Re/Si-specific NAD(P)(+) transhydrogenase subunit alpha [Pseudohongiella sp.]